MKDQELYRELNVSASATESEIKKAYRHQAKKFHPDNNKDNKEAEEKFKKVSAAYAVLSDKKKRKLYDEFGIDGLRDGFDADVSRRYGGVGGGRGGSPFGGSTFGGFSGFGGMENIFESIFGAGAPAGGGRRRQPYPGARTPNFGSQNQKGKNVQSSLEIDLMDAVLGRELELVVVVQGEKKRLNVKIPKGIESGKKIRLKGQGAQSSTGHEDGDLVLKIIVRRDDVLERKENDLIKSQKITIGEAYFGSSITVETPWGSGQLKVPEGTQGGDKLRIKGHGIRKDKIQGDLLVRMLIKIPLKSDKEAEKQIRNLGKLYFNDSR